MSRASSERRERGETLLELLITMTIMGGVILAILAGIAFAADSSDRNKKEIGVEVVLRDYAEALMAAPYNGCAAPVPVYTKPAGYDVSVTSASCYDGSSTSGGYGGSVDKGAALLTLEAHSTDASANHQRSKTLEIVKPADYARPS